MKLRTVFMVGALLTFASGLLVAQMATVPAPPSTPVTGAWKKGADFVDEAIQASKTQVEIGRLALKKSRSADVRNLATVIVKDNDETASELATIAKQRKLEVTPAAGGTQHEDLKQLDGRSGPDFDAEYARRAAYDGDRLVSLFRAESKAPDADLAAYAQHKLPQLQSHTELARRVAASSDAH